MMPAFRFVRFRALVALTCYSTGCAYSPHTLRVLSTPPGAEVLIDATPSGHTTPAEIPVKQLEYGSHELTVRKEGLEMAGPPREVRVEFRKGLFVSTLLFFYTPFPWLKVMESGYKGITYPPREVLPIFRLRPPKGGLLEFDAAVRKATNELLKQVEDRSPTQPARGQISFVADPVIDADTGEVPQLSRGIQDLLQETARVNFPRFEVAEMDSKNIDKARYVISGIIPLEITDAGDEKARHLYLSAINRTTGEIMGHADVWIANTGLDAELTPMYRDSPMYLKDARVKALIATARATAGNLADSEYFNSLSTNALLTEAAAAYNQGDHLRALGLFAKAAERGDGKTMKTYSGLYQSFFKLRRTAEAGQAFAALAALGIRNGDLSVKFLFNVNATEFFGDTEDIEEYQIWLHQIGKIILQSRSCVEIVGHASHSGTEEYNQALSLRRAQLIQASMIADAQGIEAKTTALGRGFTENIIGTGANDSSDAIDRRVEFKISLCSG